MAGDNLLNKDVYQLKAKKAITLFANASLVVLVSKDLETDTQIDSTFKEFSIKSKNAISFIEVKKISR